jgi:probable HAF family extracellular repeat protein
MFFRPIPGLVCLALLFACETALASPTYSVILLNPSISGNAYSSKAFGINEKGDVVGSTAYGGGDYLTVWSHDGAVLKYPGSAASGQPSLHMDAFGINDSRQVFAGNSPSVLIGIEGTVTAITGTGSMPSAPRAINNAGLVVGSTAKVINGRNSQTAFAWSAQNGVVDLGAQVGVDFATSQALAVNQSGDAAGSAKLADGYHHAVLWTKGTAIDLGRLANTNNSQAWGMNDVGTIVGDSGDNEATDKAFIWTNALGMRELGSLPDYGQGTGTTAYDINNSGQVIGYSGKYFNHVGFFWDENDGMRRLDELIDQTSIYSGMKIIDAAAINDAGQIAATAIWQGRRTAVLLSPSAIPEPGSAGLIFAGLGSLLFFVRASRRRTADRVTRHY